MKKLLALFLTLALLLSVLPMALGVSAAEATGSGDYAIYFDNSSSNNFWVTQKDSSHLEIGMEEPNLPAGNTYTVEFDIYSLTLGSNVVFGATTSTWDTTTAIENGHQVWKSAPANVNEWTHYSFNVTTTADWKGVMFYVTGDGFKGYIDNLTIKDSQGTVVSSFEPTADDISNKSNCASIVELSADVAYAKNIDYALYVDNSESAEQSAKIWFNILSMPQLSIPANGKTYTLKFDSYTLCESTTKFQYQGVHSTGGGMTTDSNRWYTTDVLNNWATQSVQFTATGDQALAYHTLIVGAGFEGYLDNFRVYDGETLVARLEFDVNQLGKTHECATVVALEPAIAKAKGTENFVTYKMLFDEGEIFRTTTVNAPISIKFDYCLMDGNVEFKSNTDGASTYLELGVHENFTYTPGSGATSFMFTALNGAAELYVWDIELVANGITTKFESRSDRTTCEFEIIKYDNIPEYVEKDYGMLVDTTSLATDGATNKSFWFNELGMASYYNTLVAGETYTFAFDVYPIEFVLTQNEFHFRTSSGSTSTNAGFWKATDLVKNQWNTTSTTFTVNDAAATGNHILFVYGGFKGYVDNVRIIDSQGNVVAGTSHNFNGLTVPEKHVDYLTIDVLSDEISSAKEPCVHVYKYSETGATCTVPGGSKYTCTLCGNVANEVVGEPLGHSYDNACDIDCNVCSEVREVEGHVDANGDNICDVCAYGDYAIYFDNTTSNSFWLTGLGMASPNLPADNSYTVEMDVYALTQGANIVFNGVQGHFNTDHAIPGGQVWKDAPTELNKWVTLKYDITTTATLGGVYLHILGDAGFKGYVDNFKIKDSTGAVIFEFEPNDTTKTSNGASIVALSKELEYAKNPDYAIYIDNSANDIQSNKIWFNELSAPKMSLEPGKTYTLKFDNYALNSSFKGHCYEGIHGTGGGITGQNWWDTVDRVNGWATQTVNFTPSGDQALAYHTLYVGAGFKGYLDNFRVYDGETEVARLEFDSSNLGKTSASGAATVVLVPQEVFAQKAGCIHTYAISNITYPDCDDDGVKSYTCSACGDIVDIKFADKTGHSYDNACDTNCNVCDEVREVPDHVYDNACDADCNVCNAIREVEDHKYDNACDTNCNVCDAVREVPDHVYDNACDTNCNVCDEVREVPDHVYDNACDADCNVCNAIREVEDHKYDNACDTNCNVCDEVREVPDHVYDNACDADCNVCNAIREVPDHVYDNACDANCNVCDEVREVPDHVYDNACDADCNVCNAIREVPDHVYDNACDANCNVCDAVREVPDHVYDNACDADCNVCNAIREVEDHKYDNACDTNCNVCDEVREVPDHVYDNACDADCNVCNAIREVEDHKYDNACDTNCNVCDAVREVPDHVYDNACDANCNVCDAVREVPDHVYDNACDADCNVCNAIREVGDHVYRDEFDAFCDNCNAIREINYPAESVELKEINGVKYIYVNGRTSVEGLFKVGNDYYYATWGGVVLTGDQYVHRSYCDKAAGKHLFFAEDGKMVVKGFATVDGVKKLYIDGRTSVEGLFEVDGKYYLATWGGVVLTDGRYYITESFVEGLEAGKNFTVNAEGEILDGIVEIDGQKYLYDFGTTVVPGDYDINGTIYTATWGGLIVE